MVLPQPEDPQQRHKLFVMDVEVQPIQNALTIKFHYDVSQRNDHRVCSFLSYILLVTQIRKKTGVLLPHPSIALG